MHTKPYITGFLPFLYLFTFLPFFKLYYEPFSFIVFSWLHHGKCRPSVFLSTPSLLLSDCIQRRLSFGFIRPFCNTFWDYEGPSSDSMGMNRQRGRTQHPSAPTCYARVCVWGGFRQRPWSSVFSQRDINILVETKTDKRKIQTPKINSETCFWRLAWKVSVWVRDCKNQWSGLWFEVLFRINYMYFLPSTFL